MINLSHDIRKRIYARLALLLPCSFFIWTACAIAAPVERPRAASQDAATTLTADLAWGTVEFESHGIPSSVAEPFPDEPKEWAGKKIQRWFFPSEEQRVPSKKGAPLPSRQGVGLAWNKAEEKLLLTSVGGDAVCSRTLFQEKKSPNPSPNDSTKHFFTDLSIPLTIQGTPLQYNFDATVNDASYLEGTEVTLKIRSGWKGRLPFGNGKYPLSVACGLNGQFSGEGWGWKIPRNQPSERNYYTLPGKIFIGDTFYRMKYQMASREGKPVVRVDAQPETVKLGKLVLPEKTAAYLAVLSAKNTSEHLFLLEPRGGEITLPEGEYLVKMTLPLSSQTSTASQTLPMAASDCLQSREGVYPGNGAIDSKSKVQVKAGETVKRDYGIGLDPSVQVKQQGSVLRADFLLRDSAGLTYSSPSGQKPPRLTIRQNGRVLHEANFEYG